MPSYIPKWDPSSFLRDFEAGRYAFFVSKNNYETGENNNEDGTVLDNNYLVEKKRIISKYYHLEETIEDYHIYARI